MSTHFITAIGEYKFCVTQNMMIKIRIKIINNFMNLQMFRWSTREELFKQDHLLIRTNVQPDYIIPTSFDFYSSKEGRLMVV